MVPQEYVAEYYLPGQRLQKILANPRDSLEEEVCAFVAQVVDAAAVRPTDLGVTGSILLEIHNPKFSDIDLIVCGLENARRVRSALKEHRLARTRPVAGRTLDEWCARVAEHFPLSFDEACHLARRRWNYSFFEDRYFSIHPTRTDEEIEGEYGDRVYREEGTARIEAVVTDASESLFKASINPKRKAGKISLQRIYCRKNERKARGIRSRWKEFLSMGQFFGSSLSSVGSRTVVFHVRSRDNRSASKSQGRA